MNNNKKRINKLVNKLNWLMTKWKLNKLKSVFDFYHP